MSVCVCVYLGGGDAVDEADLLKALLAHGKTDLPARVHHFVHYGEGRPRLVRPVLHVQVHVAAEPAHLKTRNQNSCRFSGKRFKFFLRKQERQTGGALTGSLVPFRYTLTPLLEPAMSYARLVSSATVSRSRDCILNLAKSGWKEMHV